MAKTAKKTTVKKQPAKTAASIPDQAKISLIAKAENPFTPGSAVYKRVEAVIKAKTVADALKKGARKSTVKWARDHKIVRVAA